MVVFASLPLRSSAYRAVHFACGLYTAGVSCDMLPLRVRCLHPSHQPVETVWQGSGLRWSDDLANSSNGSSAVFEWMSR
jgi:hypothetical protein